MRNLKRALSLAMASIMLLGMMVVGAGAVSISDFSDGEKIVNKEAVTVLTTLGVIEGNTDGTYAPESTVKRGEMAKMICVILNGGKDPQLGETVKNSYTDTSAHWAKAYIEYCTTLGIIAGRNDGTFDPEGTVTVAEAGKMLLVALGYNAGVEGYTGANWQINTDVRANQIGLYDELGTLNTNVALTRDNAAQVCYNALDQKIVEYNYVITGTVDNSITTKPQLNDSKRGTLLFDKFGAIKVEGVVVANEFANLSSTKIDTDKAPSSVTVGSALDTGKTSIVVTNAEDQADSADKVYFTNKETTFTTASGEEELGKSVWMFVKPESTSLKSTVIGSVIISDENQIVTDASGDKAVDVADDNNLDMDADVQYIYNYANMSKTIPANKDGMTGIQKTLVDTDSDNKVDYVLYKEMNLGKVTLYTEAKDGQLVVATDVTLNVKDKKDVVGFEDVEKDNYVLTAFFGGKLHVQKAETVTGKIDAYKQTGNAAPYRNTGFTIDGETYTVSRVKTYTGDLTAAVTEVDKTILSSAATFYKDLNGYVIAYGEVDESAYKYAYVWGAEAGTTIGTDRVKVTLEDGTTRTYDLNSNSDIDVVKSGAGDGRKEIAQDEIQGNVYTYTITSSGDIKLYLPKGGAVTEKQPIFTKGLTNVQFMGTKFGKNVDSLQPVADPFTALLSSTYYTGNATTFFYVTLKADNTVKDVTVYNGRNNAPSVDGTDGSAVLALRNTTGADVGAAVFTGVTVAESAGDHMFVYNANYVWEDYGYVDAFFNGKTEATKDAKVAIVDKDGEIVHNPTVNDGIYLYKTTSKGYYELTVPTASYYITGHVSRVSKANNTFVIEDTNKTFVAEVQVTNSSVVVDYDSSDSSPIAYTNGSVSAGDTVQVIVNNRKDCQVLMAAIMDRDTTGTGGGTVPTEMKTTVNADNSIDVFNPSNTSATTVMNAAAAALAAKGYTDIASSAVSTATIGNSYGNLTAKSGYVSLTFPVYNAARLDVNGATVGYTHNGGSVAVNSKTANARMITTINDGTTLVYEKALGSTILADGNKVASYRFAAADANKYGVVTLTDASKVNFTGSTVDLKSNNANHVTTNYYVAVGTELLVTGASPLADRAITATANGVTTTGTATTTAVKATMNYTTTKDDVVFAEITAAKNVAVTLAKDVSMAGQAAYTGTTYTTQSGADKFTVKLSSATGVQGGTVKVTVTPTQGVSASTQITLTAANGATISPANMTWSPGQMDAREFTITLSSVPATIAETISISDNTTARYKLTVDGGAPILLAVGDDYTVSGSGSTAYKSVANSVTDYALYTTDYTMTAHDAAITTGYVQITVNETAVAKTGVTSTATVAVAAKDAAGTADTFYALANANNVVVTYTLGGTDATDSANTTLTYDIANLTNMAITGNTVAEVSFVSATGVLTVVETKAAVGTITGTVTVGAVDFTVADPS